MPFTTKKPLSAMRLVMRVGVGLLTLAILAAVIAGLSIWYIRVNRVTATALFRVAAVSPAIIADESAQRRDERNYEIVKKSQLAALRNYFVLMAALRAPGIASLPTFASVDDPAEWLAEHLEAEYPEEGEYLAISLSGPEWQSDDLVLIVDAVAEAYRNEVIYKEKQRQLELRDLLNSKLERLNTQIAQKCAEFYEIAKWMRSREPDSSDILDQPGVILLDQIDPRMLQQKNGQLAPETPDGFKSFDNDKQLIEKLPKQSDHEQQTLSPGYKMAEFNARKREILVLEKLAVELAEKLKRIDMEVGMPPRVEQVQQATIEK